MKTTRHELFGAALIGGMGCMLSAAPAKADVMLVVVDMSGSMTSSRPNTDGRGATRFQAAKYLARNSVEAVRVGRRYGLWTFNGTTHTQIVGVEDYPDPEDSKAAVLAGIDALSGPTDRTPLARALCEAVDVLLPYWMPPVGGVDERPMIELFSDGLENSTSMHECAGPPAANHLDPESPSWEYLVRNKVRYGDVVPPSSPSPLPYIIVNADYLFEYETDIVTRASMTPAFSFQQPVKKKSPLALSLQYEGVTLAVNPSIQLQINIDFFSGLTALTKGAYRQFADSQALPQLGDFTGDRCVDNRDYQKLVDNWGRTVPRKSALDPNSDGRVDVNDYMTLVQNYGEGCKQ
jgi:hypothetical protein